METGYIKRATSKWVKETSKTGGLRVKQETYE